MGNVEVSEQEIKDFREIFNLVDKDKGGTISVQEVQDLMDMLGMQMSEAETRAMVAEIDLDGNGEIDFEEFLIIVAGQKNTSCNKRELLRAFRIVADPNLPSGYIHPKSLKEALIHYHPNIDEKEAEKLVGQLLTTSEGLINYADEVDIFLT